MSTNHTTWSYVYKAIMDEMNEYAFSFCKGILFPICDYKVLEIEDIRPIDLAEKLTELSDNLYAQRANKSITGTVNWYIYIMRMYFDQFLSCKTGSRAEKYKHRAKELMDQVTTDDWTSQNGRDIVLIFLSILHVFDSFEQMQTHSAVDLSLSIDQEDAILLKKVWDNMTPMVSTEKKNLIVKEISRHGIEQQATKFAYIMNIIYLTQLLQERGAFNAGENNE